uniref:Uncharacterized protein n=1 Tax=Cucumis melo TaxID=3656 RepID=A0A9I9CNB5_CUCME
MAERTAAPAAERDRSPKLKLASERRRDCSDGPSSPSLKMESDKEETFLSTSTRVDEKLVQEGKFGFKPTISSCLQVGLKNTEVNSFLAIL